MFGTAEAPVFPLERVSRSAPNFFWVAREWFSMAGSAYDYALRLLTARAYTSRDLRRKLDQRGFDREEAEATIERLESNGLLNDERYAEEFARQRLVNQGSSRRRVEQLLARKGISREVATFAAEKVIEEEEVDLIAAMERIARKKLMSLGELDVRVKRQRLFGFLARKGYDLDEIEQVMSRVSL